ncbi:MAG: alkaline phosphatase [Bacteroidales bacterium]|nr:alkaline phosphatase [Bacteroidales bacterium]
MKTKLNKAILLILFLGVIISCTCNNIKNSETKKPKYIFLFIGDGMGTNHVNLTQAYLKSINGEIGYQDLTMTKFPISGTCSTYCKNRLITDSGAAGSAIACGKKANTGVISFYDDLNEGESAPISIAKIAHANSMKVGIITSVSINHATPAAFYAVNKSRSNYYDIGLQLPESKFEFFAGGGFKYPKGRKSDKEDLYDICMNAGYNYLKDIKEITTFTKPNEKILFVNPVLGPEADMPYEIDRTEYDGYSLSQIVSAGIDFLDNENGFFMMVEGGKIDWAAHENDAATIIKEVLAFDDAISEAYNFYLKHPDETLIIITADHETGGISLGLAQNGYKSDFSLLANQKMSSFQFSTIIQNYKDSNSAYNIDDVINLANSHFFIEKLSLTDYEMDLVNSAYNYYFHNKTDLKTTQIGNLYGNYNPLSATFINILRNKASVGFTSWSHTAASVPVYSVGEGAERFSGNIDNTEISKRIANIMSW